MTPFTNPANEGTLEGVFKTVLEKFSQTLDSRLPCVVLSVDRNKNRVSVKPLIPRLKTDGSILERSQIVNVPIQNMSAGGFIINFPVSVGDFGWIQANDRDITIYKQGYKQSKPNTKRKHSFEDGVYIPDVTNHNLWNIAGEDAQSLVIQSYDGRTKITLSNSDVKIVAPTKITLNSPTVEVNCTSYNVNATSSTITGSITNNGTDVGSTHIHAQGSDSDGDAEQDTTPPIN